jgi:hypothetical protein
LQKDTEAAAKSPGNAKNAKPTIARVADRDIEKLQKITFEVK